VLAGGEPSACGAPTTAPRSPYGESIVRIGVGVEVLVPGRTD
jgi:hypothetical protein